MSELNELFKQVSNEKLSQIDSLVELGSSISNESKVMAFIESTKSKFYDYVSRVQHFINAFKFAQISAKQIDARAMLEAYGKQNYAENRKMIFEVAPGFSGSLPEFMSLMLDHLLPAAESSENSLKVIITRLATVLNEPDRLKAQSGIRDLEHHLVLISSENLDKVKSFFKTGAKSQTSVGQVMGRNADMQEVYTKTNQMNERLAKVDFKKVQGLVARLGQLTGSLNEQINKGGEGETRDEVAGLVASQLADLFYRLGITLTACSVLIEIGRQHSEAMARNVEGVNAQLPKPLRDVVLETGCQSASVAVLAEKHPAEVMPLIKRMLEMKKITDLQKTSNAAIRIYDNLCESWYLSDITDEKAAIKQFQSDVSKAEHDLKAIAA